MTGEFLFFKGMEITCCQAAWGSDLATEGNNPPLERA